jgi:hypothetical protein
VEQISALQLQGRFLEVCFAESGKQLAGYAANRLKKRREVLVQANGRGEQGRTTAARNLKEKRL